MTTWLKQSTAATVVIGPFVASSDFVTPSTALTISQADIRLSKNGGAYAQTNNAAGAAHLEGGDYGVPLNTTDTATLGTLRVRVAETGALVVWRDFMVVPANVWDSMFGTDKLEVDPTLLGGAAQSLADLKHFADSGYDPATSKVEGVKLADTVTTYTGNTPQTGDAWARLGAPAGASVSADVAAVKSDTGTIKTKTDQLAFTGANKVDAAIVAAGDFAQGAADKVWASATRTLSSFGSLVADMATAVWGATTRTLTTIVGLTGYTAPDNAGIAAAQAAAEAAETAAEAVPTAVEVADEVQGRTLGPLMHRTTIATLATQVSFTLTDGSADDNAYNGALIVIQDAATGTQRAHSSINDYVGSSRTVTLQLDPGIFTMAVGDRVSIFADASLKPTVPHRRLIVSSTEHLWLDFGNVVNPGSALALSGTTIKSVTDVETAVAAAQGDITTIKGKTDSLTFTMAGKVDSNPLAINGSEAAAKGIQQNAESIAVDGVVDTGASHTTFADPEDGTVAVTAIPVKGIDPAFLEDYQWRGKPIHFRRGTATTTLRSQSSLVRGGDEALQVLYVDQLAGNPPAEDDIFTIS